MKTSRLAKSTAIYSVGNIFNKAIGFVLLPLYTSYLTSAEYGTLDLLLVVGTIFLAFFSFRLPSATIRWCSEKRNTANRGKIIFSSFAFLALVGTSLILLLSPLSGQISNLLFTTKANAHLVQYIIWWVALEIVIDLPMQLLRLEEKATQFVGLSLLKLLTVLSLNIYFVSYLERGVEGILLSQLIGSTLIVLATLPFLWKRFELQLNSRILRDMIKFSFPLVFASLSAMALTYADRFVFTYYAQLDLLGVYSLGYRIASVIQVAVLTSFQLSFTPFAYEYYEQEDFEAFYRKTVTQYAVVLGFCVLGIGLLGPDLVRFFIRSATYYAALNIVPIIGLFFFFKGLEYLFTLTLHLVKKTKYLVQIVLLGLAINVPLNFLLIPTMGLYGAAITTLVAGVISCWYAYHLGQKQLPMKYDINSLRKIILLLIAFTGLALYLPAFPLYLRLIIGGTSLALYAYLVFRWHILDYQEFWSIFQRIKKRLNL